VKLSLKLDKFTILIAVLITLAISPLLLYAATTPKFYLLFLILIILLIKFIWEVKFYFNFLSKILFLSCVALILSYIINVITTKDPIVTTLLGSTASRNGLISNLSYVLIFLLFASRKNNFQINTELVFKNLFYLGLINSIYGLMQYYGYDLVPWTSSGSSDRGIYIYLMLGNTNYSSLLLNFTLIATLYFVSDLRNHKPLLFIGWLSILVHLVLLFLIFDIQGIVTLLISIFFIFRIWIIQYNFMASILLKLWWFLLLITSFFSVLGLRGVGPLASFLFKESLIDRLYTWTIAWDIIKNNFIFGVGMDSFFSGYSMYRTVESVEYRRKNFDSYVDNAHNIFLQNFATGGIFVFLSYFLVWLLVLIACLRVIKNPKIDPRLNWLVVLWFASQLYMTVSPGIIPLSVWTWIFAGLIASNFYCTGLDSDHKIGDKKPMAKNRVSNYSKNTTVFASLIIASIITGKSLYSDYLFVKARSDLLIYKQNDPRINISNIYDSAKYLYSIDHKVLAARILANSGNEFEALELSQNVIDLFPRSLAGWDTIATIYEQSGRSKLAIPYRKMTVQLDPLNPRFKSLLAKNLAVN